MTRRETSVSRRHCCVVILATASFLTLLLAFAEVRLSRLPFQRDYGEGHVLWLTQQIFDTHKVYRPLDSLPWIVCPYTPGYLVAARLTGALVGDRVGDLLAAGRGLSLVSTAGTGMVIGLTILFATPVRFPLLWRLAAAAFGGAAALAADSVFRWAPLMRVDMLALFLMYSGLGVYIALGKRERWQYAAGVLFLLALFTKQTMVSGPLACLIVGLLTCPRKTLRVYACMAVAGLAGVFWLNAVTHGGFLTHIVQYNRNPFSWRLASGHVYQHIHDSLAVVVMGAAAFLGVLNPVAIRRSGWRRFLQGRCGRTYDRAVVIAALNGVLAGMLIFSIGKVGSNINYYLDWDISIGLLCGLLVFRLLATWETRPWRGKRVYVILVILLLSAALVPSPALAGALLPSAGLKANAEEDAEVIRILRESPGPALSENLLLLLQAGKAVEVEPATLSYITNTGQWNERRYVELLDRGYFRMLVACDLDPPDFYTPAVKAAIDRDFVIQQKVGRYTIYRPVPAAEKSK